MKTTILLFGNWRERLKAERMTLDLPEGTAVGAILDHLCDTSEEAVRWRQMMKLAVNCRYVPADHCLHEGDEVALIPPVAGG